MSVLRTFGWDSLGFLPHDCWGGGPDGDGTDPFGDTVRGVDISGDCYDPGVHRQGPDSDRVAAWMAAQRNGTRSKKRHAPAPRLICPGANYRHAIIVEQIAPTVQRRRHRHATEPAQAAAAE